MVKIIFLLSLSLISEIAFPSVDDFGLLDLANGKLFKGRKTELTLKVFSEPFLKSEVLGSLNITTSDHGASVEFKKNDSTLPSVTRELDLKFSDYCGTQLFALITFVDYKNDFYLIKDALFTGWVQGQGYRVSELNKTFPLSFFSAEGHEIRNISQNNGVIKYKEINSENYPVVTKDKSSGKEDFLENGEINLEISCEAKDEMALVKKYFVKEEVNHIKEPYFINLYEGLYIHGSQEKKFIKSLEIYETSDSQKTVGKLEVNQVGDSLETVYVSADKKNEIRFQGNNPSRCSNGNILLHQAKETKGELSNIGNGPWGKDGWIKFKAYGLYGKSFPYHFLYLSDDNFVKFYKENGEILAKGFKLTGRYGDADSAEIVFPVNYSDLFDENGILKIRINPKDC